MCDEVTNNYDYAQTGVDISRLLLVQHPAPTYIPHATLQCPRAIQHVHVAPSLEATQVWEEGRCTHQESPVGEYPPRSPCGVLLPTWYSGGMKWSMTTACSWTSLAICRMLSRMSSFSRWYSALISASWGERRKDQGGGGGGRGGGRKGGKG